MNVVPGSKKIQTSPFSDLKILIIEDDQDARFLLRNMLVDLGVGRVFEAGDGDAALQFMDSAVYFINIVICDWNLPGVSGIELLRKMRVLNPILPFLMVTGRRDLESVIEAKSAGVSGYIGKPFSAKQLDVKLRVLLQRALIAC